MSYISRISAEVVFNILAAEYYDSILHPTCNNFRNASMQLVSRWLGEDFSSCCDIGCGNSVVAELLAKRYSQLSEISLVDSSPAMLEHSSRWTNLGAKSHIGYAEQLPFADNLFSRVVASLADPYNHQSFWMEAKRVVSPEGLIIFTTPSYEWASAFRQNLPPMLANSAEFELRGGQHVSIPSYIYPEAVQTQMIEQASLSLVDIEYFTLGEFSGEALSPKLHVLKNPREPVVTAYIARR